jgi:hypothetical protein
MDKSSHFCDGRIRRVNGDSIRESDLRGLFRRDEVEKSPEYFVYFKISRQNHGGTRPQSAEAVLDRRLPKGAVSRRR